MWILSLIAFLILGGYLLLCAMRFGLPDMVSDTYYQLQGTTGSTIIGTGKKRNFGWLFSAVMTLVAFLMMVCLLDSGNGVQCLAFLGCAGLCFVGCAPNYLERDDYKVHKTAAIVAAIGCVGWSVSVCWWVTLVVACIYALYLVCAWLLLRANKMWHIFYAVPKTHPWYWAEVAGFVATFLTYWLAYNL